METKQAVTKVEQLIAELVTEGGYSLLVDMERIRPSDQTMQFAITLRNENGDVVAKQCDPDLAKAVTRLYTELIGDLIDDEEREGKPKPRLRPLHPEKENDLASFIWDDQKSSESLYIELAGTGHNFAIWQQPFNTHQPVSIHIDLWRNGDCDAPVDGAVLYPLYE